MNPIDTLKSDLAKIGDNPDASKIGTAVAKAVHASKQARPARPGTGKPASKKPAIMRKIVVAGSLRKA